MFESIRRLNEIHCLCHDEFCSRGVITDFRRISGSADQANYQIAPEPFIALLDNQYRTHRFFVNKSVPEVIGQILQEHGLKDKEYEFTLKQ